MVGRVIAFEGLDQSGKQTQAEMLRDSLKVDGRKARLVSFPDYGTSIGEEIARALQGEREYGPDVMQLLYIANRYERKPDLLRWLDGGLVLVCDRYLTASGRRTPSAPTCSARSVHDSRGRERAHLADPRGPQRPRARLQRRPRRAHIVDEHDGRALKLPCRTRRRECIPDIPVALCGRE